MSLQHGHNLQGSLNFCPVSKKGRLGGSNFGGKAELARTNKYVHTKKTLSSLTWQGGSAIKGGSVAHAFNSQCLPSVQSRQLQQLISCPSPGHSSVTAQLVYGSR